MAVYFDKRSAQHAFCTEIEIQHVNGCVESGILLATCLSVRVCVHKHFIFRNFVSASFSLVNKCLTVGSVCL